MFYRSVRAHPHCVAWRAFNRPIKKNLTKSGIPDLASQIHRFLHWITYKAKRLFSSELYPTPSVRRTSKHHGRFMQYRMPSLEAKSLYALLEDVVGVMHTVGVTPCAQVL